MDRNSPDWFNVLDLDFDPGPVWTRYRGKLILILGAHDDSTPTEAVVRRWSDWNALRASPAEISVVSDAQHIGLNVREPCQTDLADIPGFSPGFIAAIRGAARTVGLV